MLNFPDEKSYPAVELWCLNDQDERMRRACVPSPLGWSRGLICAPSYSSEPKSEEAFYGPSRTCSYKGSKYGVSWGGGGRGDTWPGHLCCYQETNCHTCKGSDVGQAGSSCSTLWPIQSGSGKPHSFKHRGERGSDSAMIFRKWIIKQEKWFFFFKIFLLLLKR